jgi:hypothetical protein
MRLPKRFSKASMMATSSSSLGGSQSGVLPFHLVVEAPREPDYMGSVSFIKWNPSITFTRTHVCVKGVSPASLRFDIALAHFRPPNDISASGASRLEHSLTAALVRAVSFAGRLIRAIVGPSREIALEVLLCNLMLCLESFPLRLRPLRL